ncbi:T9SS type A sorting domain-containing protein [Algibacter sp. 2305UL17-15]|uniref:T9SS type A sorting domain-containing protein n=1 Tax=Algibacter sp. 2305UL17-15 TaxID=3231268 RepID=UPI00345847EF
MKKTLHLFLCLSILFCSSILLAQDVYVATNGNDTTGDGTIGNPYLTFNKAVSVMNTAKNTCIIRGGIYEESLIVNKNGNSTTPLTFKAAAGENVEIRATSIVNGWSLHSGSIYKATVNMTIDSRFRAVYHNDEYMDLARWPNNTDNDRWTVDCTPVTGGDGTHFLDNTNNIPGIDWTGGLVYYLGAHSGTSWTRTITSSTTSRIDFTAVNTGSWPFSIHNPGVWRAYPGNNTGQMYLFNKLEALDHAREWYYDSGTNTLYLQTANGTLPANDSVEYARTKYVAEITGDYVNLEDLNFFGGSIKIHNNADNNQILNCQIIHGSEGHDELNNTDAQVGEASIEVLGDNTIIKDCTIDHSSVSGIFIAGWAASNGTFEGNYISNIDYVGIHASPIRSSANNMEILKNTILNAGRDGMYVAGSNCEVAYNDVSASQQINSDSGVFYTVGNASLKNNEIHHNWFHDATAPAYSHAVGEAPKAAGIYLDNDSKGYVVHHNVVWNVSWTGYQVNWNNTFLDFFHNTIWNAQDAMDSWVNGHSQSDNKVYNNYASAGDWHPNAGDTYPNVFFDIQDNLITPTSPFEDANNQDFMPKNGSAVVDQGQLISGINDSYKDAAPDIGAYELGGTQWTAGVNAIEDTGDVLSTSEVLLSRVQLFPNPAHNNLNIVLPNNLNYTKGLVEVYSLMGRNVKTMALNGNDTTTVSLPIANLASGTYLVRLIASNGTSYTSKFIKN